MACTMISHDMLGPSPRGDSGMAPPSYLDVPQSGPGIRNKAWHRVGPPAPQATMTDLRHAGSDFHTFTSPSSRPINDFDSDAGSEVFGHSAQGLPPVSPSSSHASLMQHASTFNPYQQAGFQAVAQHHLSQNATATATLSRNASMAVREPAGVLTVVGHANSLTPAAPGFDPSARPSMERSSAAKFRTDLMVARTGSNAMDRYKALTRLLSSVKRDMAAVGMDQPFKAASWGIQHHELLCRIVEIGEALSGFGTADFGERSNSSRAINTKDYAYLLKMYGEAHWGMYRQEFIEAMPHAMQDEMWTVRGLLTVRFEANAIIQDQLMKHVGLEPGGGQGAVVYNTSVVTANPVNSVSSKPNNQVHAYAASAAKVVQNSSHKLGMIAVASVAGLWMIKRTGMLGFVPGMGRPRGRRSRDDMSDETSGPSRRGGRGGGGRGGLSHDERLLLAFDHVDRSFKELNKAQRNIDLLKGDWRLGNFRLTSPFGGPDPPGFEAVDLPACEPRQFMHMQLGY